MNPATTIRGRMPTFTAAHPTQKSGKLPHAIAATLRAPPISPASDPSVNPARRPRSCMIRDQAVKRAISEVYEEARADAYRDRPPSASGSRQPLSAAPVLIVACVDTPTSSQAGFQTGASIYPSVQNLMLAARALGLGTVLTTLHRRRKARIHEILGIPDGVESAAIIPLGWPDREYGPNRRPPLERFVMRDRWSR